MSLYTRVLGTGGALPPKVVTNDELSQTLDTSHEWIVERSGIEARHIASPEETTLSLSIEASKKALEMASVSDVDLVIVATSTPDRTFPSTASQLAHQLGFTAAAFDMNVACAGFVYALAAADALIKTGAFKRALVVGAETMSRIVDWSDRTTAVLFGDGAGAVVLGVSEEAGIIGHYLAGDGAHLDSLYVKGGVSTTQKAGTIHMEGREVFRQAVTCLGEAVEQILKKYDCHHIDWLVPHQANKRIIDSTAKKLNLPSEKVVYTGNIHANTSAASIPLAFDVAVRDGRIQRGQTIIFEAFGAGFAWGANLLKF